MSDTTEQGWGEDDQAQAAPPAPPAPVAFPEHPKDPHNHRFTVSVAGNGPHIVVRGQTAAEISEGYQELLEANVGALLGTFWSQVKAEGQLANGMGGATPVPAGAPPAPAPQGATPPPFGPNVSVPQAPGYQGPPQAPQAPMPPQGGGQNGNNRGPKPRPDWAQVYKIDVPFAQKDAFKAFREQYKDALKGKVLWAGGGNYWVEGSVVQSFANYNPVPA